MRASVCLSNRRVGVHVIFDDLMNHLCAYFGWGIMSMQEGRQACFPLRVEHLSERVTVRISAETK